MPNPSSQTCKIALIPPEITEISLIYSHPKDVAAFAQTCKVFYALVYGSSDSHLWRLLWFCQGFDDLRRADMGVKGPLLIDWKKEVQRRTRTELLAKRNFQEASAEDRLQVLQTLIDAITTVPSGSGPSKSHTYAWVKSVVNTAQLQHRPTIKISLLRNLIASSTVYENHCLRDSEERLLRHRLHAYLGLSDLENSDQVKRQHRNEARCFVYDLRNYTKRNDWGPLTPYRVGDINWMHVDHLLDVITRNLSDNGPGWEESRPPVGLDSIRPYSAPGLTDQQSRDWAGVDGKWRRIVCFMDYRDLYEYNFAQAGSDGPRDASIFHHTEFEEATRFIYLELHITGFSPTFTQSSMPQKPVDAEDIEDLGPRPTIHFSGTSKGGSGNEASVKGLVRMTTDNCIRWSFVSISSSTVSIFDAQLQWSSEGVQVGAVGSAMGVIGTWTGAHHDDGDPAGPFWLWKTGHLDHCHKCGRQL